MGWPKVVKYWCFRTISASLMQWGQCLCSSKFCDACDMQPEVQRLAVLTGPGSPPSPPWVGKPTISSVCVHPLCHLIAISVNYFQSCLAISICAKCTKISYHLSFFLQPAATSILFRNVSRRGKVQTPRRVAIKPNPSSQVAVLKVAAV